MALVPISQFTNGPNRPVAAGAAPTCVSKVATPESASLADQATGILVEVSNAGGAERTGIEGGSLSLRIVTNAVGSTFPQLSVAEKITLVMPLLVIGTVAELPSTVVGGSGSRPAPRR